MKYYFLFPFLFQFILSFSQLIPSGSYPGNTPGIIINGESTPMKNISVQLITLNPNSKSKKIKANKGEYLILAKSGTVSITSDQINAVLTPRSVAVICKGDKFRIENKGVEKANYYIQYLSAKNAQAGTDTAKSLVRLWEDLSYIGHARGGVRNYFNKRSSQSKRLEMHVTTLNAGLTSHDPHTHIAEEIVLIIEGNTEMIIGDKICKANQGDLYFLGSNVLHGIKNTGDKPAIYFAYQWD